MLAIIASICRSLGFLTRLPINKRWYDRSYLPSDDAASFPIAGFLIGLFGAAFFLIAIFLNLGNLVAAIISIIAIIFLTGALHEDGLSDTFDGFFAPKNRDQRLEIMKDSRIGVFGALSLILSILLKIALLNNLSTQFSVSCAIIALIGAETISRAAMIWLWYHSPFARSNGVAVAAGAPTQIMIRNGLLISAFLLFLLIVPFFGLIHFIIAVLLTMFAAFLFMRLCQNKIDGITGDCLGALQQISVLAFLIGVSISYI
ncbi:adenosylcobinamide-GDP ribazoletransferase [Bartonella sp. HY038]|uniref:adenosylcobinamide-GDP ribazoletransferase n=1 Tax=Bartonella sp. HY038 TaxID=2759660 RepID=UPI0015F7AFD9|nr:adenosylcobinamide-GDP ribazoletransferase [Bartonella sp. HY038]